MAVIINEFEAVVEPPRRPEPEPGVELRPEGKEAAIPLTPLDMEEVLRQRLERLARLLAD